ncbi:MAG TPA: hypothetical protein VOA88_20970 [Candidatus Dormibacteraeota bacterium]|nr:hypothetical protein [Candidatus Dormibacteraeota bacterium]
MFEFRFDSATKTRLLVKLQGMSPRFVEVVATKLRALMFQLQSKIVSEKLSGQVLHRRTGVLAGSVRTLPVTVAGNQISSGVASSSGPAFYGKIHEVGGSRPYQIFATKARALQFMQGPRTVYAQNIIHPPAKMRAFMRPSLIESAQEIRNELQAAIDEELKKK